MSRKITYSEVAAHTGRHDLWVVIHDKVLDLSKFVDEHPGGEEVLVDQGGKDATEPFEDVSHSEEARRLVETLVIGVLDKTGGPKGVKPVTAVTPASRTSGSGLNVYLMVLLLSVLAAFGAYRVTLA